MKYSEFKNNQQKEVNKFSEKYIFFAFNEKQFHKGMASLGLKPSDTDKVYKDVAGGFVLKSKNQEYKNLIEKLDKEKQEYLSNKENLFNALVYELNNHEYCITCDATDAVESLGLDIEDIDREVLNKACLKSSENSIW